MKPLRCILLSLFCFAIPYSAPSTRLHSQELVLKGKYETVVTEFPFRISYSGTANFYWWTVPNGWAVKEDKGEITVLSAPEGKAEVKLTTWHVDFDKKTTETKETSLSFSIGKVAKLPNPPIDPPNGKLPPNPVPTQYFFMVVRESDPPTLAFTQLVSDPTWQTLDPHKMKDYTLKQARDLGATIVVGQKMPCVVGLYLQPNGRYKQKAVFNAPTNSDEIKSLPNKMR